ncbi:MAG: hypothetical protein ACQEWE_21455, partial [Bacillota bacterium]
IALGSLEHLLNITFSVIKRQAFFEICFSRRFGDKEYNSIFYYKESILFFTFCNFISEGFSASSIFLF